MRRTRHLPLLRILLTTLVLALGVALAPSATASPTAAPVRIMPLGDSITGSPRCWRAVLWNRLQSTGYRNIDFVGTLNQRGCSQALDGDNEGHGGELVTDVANRNLLPGRLAATRPDIVIMHFGTTDVWNHGGQNQRRNVGANGTQAVLWTGNGGSNQRWTLR